MKKRIHISTAKFGGEELKKSIPEQINDNYEIELISYHDNNTKSRSNSLHPRTKGKIPKMLEWLDFDADYYIWMDAPMNFITNDIGNLVEKSIEDFDICLFKHPLNSSIKKELYSVENEIGNGNQYHISRYEGEYMQEQVNSYLEDPSFIDDNLFACGFFIYSRKLIENRNYNLMTDWFFHNCYWSIQDQLSLPYLLHKHNTKWKTFQIGDVYNNQFTKYQWMP